MKSGYLTSEEIRKIRMLLGDMVEACEIEDTTAPISAFLESQEALIASSAASELEDEIAGIVGENYSYLEGLYHYLYEHPELAHGERNTFKGPGGHGAMPDVVANPINLASRFVMDLSKFVGRIRESGPAVLSVGSFHECFAPWILSLGS